MNAYEQAAQRGAALLDQYLPRWRDNIDTNDLHLADCSKCVLGQVFGTYSDGQYELGLDGEEVVEYGFSSDGESPQSWGWLTRAWKKVLA